jgi:hypothetical protein
LERVDANGVSGEAWFETEMSRAETRHEQIERLAMRIASGDVVFFIGAGFSIDSEGNTTPVLISRLLARFEALTEVMSAGGNKRSAAAVAAYRLRKGLRTTFWLAKDPAGDEIGDIFRKKETRDANLTSLSQNYYLINDWICSAFESLLEHLSQGYPAGLVAEVNKRENDFLKPYDKNKFELPPIALDWLIDLQRFCRENPGEAERTVAGKALFLDTLGFGSEEVMAGKPMASELREVLDKPGERVRPRHRVLAWLAAEGLCPTLVTTNYDLLIESAYRAAGLLPMNPPDDLWKDSMKPLYKAKLSHLPVNDRYRHFKRVANAAQFFTHGDAHQSALIHKIHGCVESYRMVLDRKESPAEKNFRDFRAVLQTIVFTFREIQNWRDDSWSRDYLSTLLRTHTIVFAGYSGADPVIHDTFRTVYEDMERQQARISTAGMTAKQDEETLKGNRARAFFMDLEKKREFHGLELLRSASAAAEDPSVELTDHPNLLTFHGGDEQVFPNLDEVFLWLYHVTVRELQFQALTSELRRLRYQLFGRPCPEDEATAILEAFSELRKTERVQASALDLPPAQKYRFLRSVLGKKARVADSSRQQHSEPASEKSATDKSKIDAAAKDMAAIARPDFQRMTAWTSGFQRLLLREYQLATELQKTPTEAEALLGVMNFPWYRPLTEHPQWTAWGAVLELAIRRALAVYTGRPRCWDRISIDVEAADQHRAMVIFRALPRQPKDNGPAARRCITLELAGPRRLLRREVPQRSLAALQPLVWTLLPETVPWWAQHDERRPERTPSAADIWQWAAFMPRQGSSDLNRFFGW